MAIEDYVLEFTRLSRYAPKMVVEPRACMLKFVNGVSDLVLKECKIAMLIKDINLSSLIIHAQQIEVEKLKEIDRGNKLARTDQFEYS